MTTNEGPSRVSGRGREAARDAKRNAEEVPSGAIPFVAVEQVPKVTPEQKRAQREIEREAATEEGRDQEELVQIEADNAESIEENARNIRNLVVENGLSISNAITELRDAGWSENEVLETLIPVHVALRAKGEKGVAMLGATVQREEEREKGRKALEEISATIHLREKATMHREKEEAVKFAELRELGKKGVAILEAAGKRVETNPDRVWTESAEESPLGREKPPVPHIEEGPFVQVETKRKSGAEEEESSDQQTLTEEDSALADSRAEAQEALRKMVEMGRGKLFDAPLVNQFGIEVPANEAHIYEGPGGEELLAFGGTYPERMEAIKEYLALNSDKTIMAPDESGANRVAWSLVDGALTPSASLGKKRWFGSLLGAKLGPPELNELTKRVS